ncbi:hypothetical protein D2E25_1073 [Bifidobacterium goeldii]|uniref:Uncharacterized protein n=1 Tax=Bifidobacterium goeldii TaxID=2306975 RepID=A0A430FJY0_9BIFI|nr:hypothetical protein D2E25_1073 [Bifidobacterium goeldii]
MWGKYGHEQREKASFASGFHHINLEDHDVDYFPHE